jgi:hypothetical protein
LLLLDVSLQMLLECVNLLGVGRSEVGQSQSHGLSSATRELCCMSELHLHPQQTMMRERVQQWSLIDASPGE